MHSNAHKNITCSLLSANVPLTTYTLTQSLIMRVHSIVHRIDSVLVGQWHRVVIMNAGINLY